MNVTIALFITLVIAPCISLQAQSKQNFYPQTYFVRTVRGHGIIPETNIVVTDFKGRSISCKARDRNYKNLGKLVCATDSLIKSLEACSNCKVAKTKEQLAALDHAMKLGNLKCASDYGVPVYAMYTKKTDGSLQLINKVAKGCGKTVSENLLIEKMIAEFEKPIEKGKSVI